MCLSFGENKDFIHIPSENTCTAYDCQTSIVRSLSEQTNIFSPSYYYICFIDDLTIETGLMVHQILD